MKDRSDEELLGRYADGSGSQRDREAAFRELVERYNRRVYAICFRILSSHADAEEAAQDTFVRMARSAGTFRGDSKLSTWVYRVATSACQDLLRSAGRRPQTPVGDIAAVAVAAGADTALDETAGSDMADAVRRALAQLDEASRTLVVLCAIEGLDYAEAAAALSIPVGTVKSRLSRARVRLADLLTVELPPSERRPTPRR